MVCLDMNCSSSNETEICLNIMFTIITTTRKRLMLHTGSTIDDSVILVARSRKISNWSFQLSILVVILYITEPFIIYDVVI